jgi:hypothetical protein
MEVRPLRGHDDFHRFRLSIPAFVSRARHVARGGVQAWVEGLTLHQKVERFRDQPVQPTNGRSGQLSNGQTRPHERNGLEEELARPLDRA